MTSRIGKLGAFLRTLPGALLRNWHITLPVLILFCLCAPFTWFLLPSYEPLFADEYQPLKALKFFYSRGHEFHKWGPLTDFLLGPIYAVTMGYWYVTDQFVHPSIKFPYGFRDPIWQLTTLIFEGRVFFLLLNGACTAVLGRYLGLITRSRSVIFLTLLTMICANPVVVTLYADTKPDGPSTSFSALALCVYLVIWKRGLTTERAILFAFLATCAVSGKELCAMIFILPYLGLTVRHLWESRRRAEPLLRSLAAPAAGALTGTLAYAVVYAPKTWLERIRFWTSGPGKDSAVWGSGLKSGEMSLGRYAFSMFETLLNNVGPLGLLLIAVSLLALLVRRPAGWIFLSLPFISVVAFGLVPMGYVEDRFYIVATLTLVPVVALGLGALLDGRREPRFAPLLNTVGAIASVWYGLIAWHFIDTHYAKVTEWYLGLHSDKSKLITEGSTFASIPGKSRLAWLGYTVDMRSLGQIVSTPAGRPDVIFIPRGRLLFIEDAVRFPARARMMQQDSGFDIEAWKAGFKGMGYSDPELFEPVLPAWLPFSWVPSVREWNKREALLVYHMPAPNP
jgi:hypothetical protein